MPETGQVLTSVYASDSGGGATATVTAGTAVACRLDALSGNEGETADRISDRSTHIVSLPANTAIDVADDFQISGGSIYEVTAVRDYSDELTRVIEVVAQD
jgi:SPP1 family predicted phage head-tail adaptor